MPETGSGAVVVLISASAEWQAVRAHFPAAFQASPFGEWIAVSLEIGRRQVPVVFLHGGWGKIAAAASTQYAIDRWSPAILVNLGTCGGFAGHVGKGEIVLAERTIVYDIVERMGDADAAIAWYTTELNLAWLGDEHPQPV